MSGAEPNTGQGGPPPCSLIIRCCNEEHHIGRLLSGVMQQTVPHPEIILVDSGSTDATLEIAARFPVKIVTIAQEEFSFGRALNVGCRVATAPYLVFASAHVYPVYRDWLELMLAPFAHPKVGLVYGKQRGTPESWYSERQIFHQWFPDKSDHHQRHPFCNNANVAIRRALWEELPYDETLTGLEDLAWAREIMATGRRIVYEAAAEIVHVHNETPGRILHRYRREAIALKRVMPEERFNLWDLIRLWVGNVWSDAQHARNERVLLAELKRIIIFRSMQLWGTYRGFHQQGPVSSDLKRKFYYPKEVSEPLPGADLTDHARMRIDYSKPAE